MKRIGRVIFSALSSRALPPLVLVFFLIMYAGIAVFSDEALVMMMEMVRRNPLLLMLLASIPLNSAIRLALETMRFFGRGRLMKTGKGDVHLAGIFDETIDTPSFSSFDSLQKRLVVAGYSVRVTEKHLAAWRGISAFPSRFLFLAGVVLLFSGVFLSLTARTSRKEMLIEGEALSSPTAGTDRVEFISLKEQAGLFLNRNLTIELMTHEGIRKTFGLYPPSLNKGSFLYPRYLGIAPLVRFSAPDLPGGFESYYTLMIYPPGKEDSAEIPGTAYRIVFSLAPAEPGNDPFATGKMTLQFRVLKGSEPVAAGKVPMGGEFNEDGYRVGFSDFRRVVATDFVQDPGVIPIWMALAFFAAALLWWLPVRSISPRRELLFVHMAEGIQAASRSEGMRIRHGGIFHDALDYLEDDHASHG